MGDAPIYERLAREYSRRHVKTTIRFHWGRPYVSTTITDSTGYQWGYTSGPWRDLAQAMKIGRFATLKELEQRGIRHVPEG